MSHATKIAALIGLSLTTLTSIASAQRAPMPREPRIEPRSQLLITDLRVVEDRQRTDPRNGNRAVWSFRYLMEQMAGPHDPAEFTLRWLEQWERDQVVNGRLLPARPLIRERIIQPWLEASGGRRLDLNRAPFRLLAIVNRMDIRQHDGPSVDTAGEGRFVFGVLGPDGRPLPPLAGPATGGFSVIFEYELLARDLDELRQWTELWVRLGRHRLGSREYNDALERVTRRFTDRGRAPDEPNGNAINQIRTNEIALAAPWELREFVIDAGTGLLQQHTVALTPDTVERNGTDAFAQLINDNEAEILDGTFEFPVDQLGPGSLSGPFTSGDFPDFPARTFTTIELAPGLFSIPWSADGIDNEARHAFALNTCGGCHSVETATPFLMVAFPADHELPRRLGRPAQLARFLTGIDLPDPVDPDTTRSFDDLRRRLEDLEELARSFRDGPGPMLQSNRPKFVH